MMPLSQLAPRRAAWVRAGLAALLGVALFNLLHLAPTAPMDDTAGCDAHAQDIDPENAISTVGGPGRHQGRHLAALGVDRWHAQGHRGEKVKVAVLDSGFQGYKA